MAPARSGSSLLGHILYSHPEVTGYGESHVSYTSTTDLHRLIYRTAAVLDDFEPMDYTYIVDKIVWDYPIADAIQIKFIFLLRDPAATYTSTVHSFSGQESPAGVEQWISYYQKRLERLKTLAMQINEPNRCLTLRYEDLLGDTDRTLASFQTFLGTRTPFSDSYTVAPHTARLKYGDNSNAIRAGKILRKKFRKPILNETIFTLEKQTAVYNCYASCMTTLSQYTQLSSAIADHQSEHESSLSAKVNVSCRQRLM
ncbi:sulfotransferase family protein [Leptolyngbya sp. Heron Island J]|uniref:sulfotransferase family protein n=1 Tax=Leptolyngbya sp. Heron Island J TaxID=1385935 RepID=UPI001377CCD3|nr:sulfotransferase [Leptolyngbya sp. Heron Island J]